MERNFLIPIAIAAGFHSVILLSDRPPTPTLPPLTIVPSEPPIEIAIDDLEDEDPVVSNDGESPEMSEKPPPPSGMENLTTAIDPDDFIQKPDLNDLRPRTGPNVTSIDPNWAKAATSSNTSRRGPIGVDLLDNSPGARFQPAPVYPRELRSTGIDGDATVTFSVDVNGNVFNASVINASHSSFGEQALRAVRRWRFDPGIKDGKRVAFRMVQTFRFSISE